MGRRREEKRKRKGGGTHLNFFPSQRDRIERILSARRGHGVIERLGTL